MWSSCHVIPRFQRPTAANAADHGHPCSTLRWTAETPYGYLWGLRSPPSKAFFLHASLEAQRGLRRRPHHSEFITAMAFQSMVSGGADCGPVNPLAGFLKRQEQDTSLQRDSYGPQQQGNPGLRSAGVRPGGGDLAEAEHFLANGGGAPQNAMDMHAVRREIEAMEMHARNAPGASASVS